MTSLSRRDFVKALCAAGIAAPIVESYAQTPAAASPVKRIHVVFKTHLDIGFTAMAADVVRTYMESFIPKAVQLAQRMHETGNPQRFVWTTGSWLIYEFLERADAAGRAEMEKAIAAGDIHWHALPFSTYTELMDAHFAETALSLAAELDRRFARKTITAKMTDVPGHTRSLVPFLAQAGVKLLHIGVNSGSAVPSVPPAFRWQTRGIRSVHHADASVVVLYASNYGAMHILPGCEDALYFAHSNDNIGPQSEQQIAVVFQGLAAQYPGVEIRGGSMDDFAHALTPAVIDALPAVTSEIGDTWIHGAGSDPGRMAQLRAYQRLSAAASDKTTSERHRKADRRALIVCEHTWGLDVKSHLADWDSQTSETFSRARSGDRYRRIEQSWQEQRQYLIDAVAELKGTRLADDITREWDELKKTPHDVVGDRTPIDKADAVAEVGGMRVRLSPETGAVISLVDRTGREWAAPDSPIALAAYETFSADFFQKYLKHYNPRFEETKAWAIGDFGKPGLDKTGSVDQLVAPRAESMWRAVSNSHTVLGVVLRFPDVKPPAYGAPGRAELMYHLDPARSEILVELWWMEKPACRLPEALWISFQPLLTGNITCRVDKLGSMVDVSDVVSNGNRYLHAVGHGGAEVNDQGGTFKLTSLDAPLVAVGRRRLVKLDDELPDLRGGLHVNLFNNLWGTNFNMWYDEDARFRFRIKL